MGAYNNIDTPIAGMKSGIDSENITKRCADATIDYGLPVFGYVGDSGIGTARDDNVHTYKNDRCVMTFDGDFTAGDVITLTVNGTAVTAVTFITDQAATMALLEAAVEADIEGASASSTGRIITIDIDGTEMTVTETVVGGTEATGTAVYSSRMVFVGYSMFTQLPAPARTDLNGVVLDAATAQYNLGEAMNVMINGFIYVTTSEAVDNFNQAYAIVASGATQGQSAQTVGSNIILTGATFYETVAASGVAKVRINK